MNFLTILDIFIAALQVGLKSSAQWHLLCAMHVQNKAFLRRWAWRHNCPCYHMLSPWMTIYIRCYWYILYYIESNWVETNWKSLSLTYQICHDWDIFRLSSAEAVAWRLGARSVCLWRFGVQKATSRTWAAQLHSCTAGWLHGPCGGCSLQIINGYSINK